MGSLTFFANFLCHPRRIGALAPGSATLAKTLCRPLPWPELKRVIECGPGNGALTTKIVQHLPTDAKLICLEINRRFCQELESRFAHLPWVKILQTDAADIQKISTTHFAGPSQTDLIVMSLPFSQLPLTKRKLIIAAAHASLRPGGWLVIYQYGRHLEKLLRCHFPTLRLQSCWRNFPPAVIYYGQKN